MSGRTRAVALWGSVAVFLLATVAAAVTVGYVAAEAEPSQPAPGTDSVEAGFSRDMQVHHAQAVEMATMIRDRSDDVGIRALALDIAAGQQQQIGQMFAWLETWRVPQTGDQDPMAWMTQQMDHDAATSRTHMQPMSDGRMPGMASEEEMEQLEASAGADAEVLWLRLMIQHHRAGVEMAQAVLKLTDEPVVRRLATSMVSAQESELSQLEQLLADRAG